MRVMVIVLVYGLVLTGGLLAQQAPTAPASPAATVPALDELDKAYVQNVVLARQLANTACQSLESVKQYNAILEDVTKKIAAKHPGFTVDWSKNVLAAVKPTK